MINIWLTLAPMEPPSSGPSSEPHSSRASVYSVSGVYLNRLMATTFAPLLLAMRATDILSLVDPE